MLLLCFGLLSPSPFFLNHKVSLYLLSFSKLQLPGVVRECVRHGITRNRFGLYTEKKTKTKATRSWVYPERSILGCHLCTPTLNLPPLGCLWRGLTKVLCSGGSFRWGYWVPWHFSPPCGHPLQEGLTNLRLLALGCHLPPRDVTSHQGMLLVSWVSAKDFHPYISHLNCRDLGRGPHCLPAPITETKNL